VCLLVMALVYGFVRLGLWQLSRAGEKIALQTEYAESLNDAPATLNVVPLAGLEFDQTQIQNRLVILQGHFINEKSVFLVYQTFEDQIGFEIFTPFLNVGTEELVLVSRGWTGAASYDALVSALPDVDGDLEITGQVYVHTSSSLNKTNRLSEDVQWPLQVRYLNMPQIAGLFEEQVFPYVVRLGAGQPGVLVRYWPEVAVDTSRHFSYALQWFSMAIAVVIVSLILSSNLIGLLQGKPES
jgi:cytochrome oxidase assembly protein ShyY1